MRAIAARQPRATASSPAWSPRRAAGWTEETLKPYVEVLLEAFGPARLMWGSDWPVVNEAGGYAAWRAAAEALTERLLAGRARR